MTRARILADYVSSGDELALKAPITNAALVTPNLGTPSAGVMTNVTGMPLAGLSATGTASATTFLRGDNAWSAAGGDYVKIQTTTLGSDTTIWSIDGWISSTYKIYKLFVYNATPPTQGNMVRVQWNTGGARDDTDMYRSNNVAIPDSGTPYVSNSNTATYWNLIQNSAETIRRFSSEITLYDPENTSYYTTWTHNTVGWDGATAGFAMFGGGSVNATTALTGISFHENGGGDFRSGSTITIYGIKA